MARHTIPTRPSDRGAILTQRRRRKMARSAHAYVRGNTERFYEWLQADTQRALPQGPSIWICGDCHVGNLGPVVDGDGRVGVLIRDLDQAVIGNPAHDLIRLGLSLASACRSATGLTPSPTAPTTKDEATHDPLPGGAAPPGRLMAAATAEGV